MNPETGKLIGSTAEPITQKIAEAIASSGVPEVLIVPFVSDDIEYFSADIEDKYVIAQANTPLDENNEFVRPRVSTRQHSSFSFSMPVDIDLMDVAPNQIG